jgi:peptide/nickel transport system ATP-binding protein
MTEARFEDFTHTGDKPLLEVSDLCVDYYTERGAGRAVDHVSFDIMPGEVFGLAGESGSGKSTVAYAITRLHKPPAYIAGGSIRFDGRDVLAMDDEELRRFRWDQLSIVFQSAMNALNPVLTIGVQIIDAIRAHEPINRKQARERAKALLEMVSIDPKYVDSYPHQLSGGMRQRAVIAIALALRPALVIMDEPTTALDVVVERQILDEIKMLQAEFGFSILFITHDMSLLVEFSDRIAIMYASRLVEIGPSQQIFSNPQHPYTERLMNAFPSVTGPRRELTGIVGAPPNLYNPPGGCRFHPRCHVALEGRCQRENPLLQSTGERHAAACHLLDKEEIPHG